MVLDTDTLKKKQASQLEQSLGCLSLSFFQVAKKMKTRAVVILAAIQNLAWVYQLKVNGSEGLSCLQLTALACLVSRYIAAWVCH